MSTNSRIPDCLQQIFAGFLSLRMRTVVSALQWRPGTVASSLLAISDSGACRAFEMLVHGLTESKSREKKMSFASLPNLAIHFYKREFYPSLQNFPLTACAKIRAVLQSTKLPMTSKSMIQTPL